VGCLGSVTKNQQTLPAAHVGDTLAHPETIIISCPKVNSG